MTTRISLHPTSRRFSFAFALTALLAITLATIPAPCQTAPQPAAAVQAASTSQATAAPAAQPAFEVASVRECPKDHGYFSQGSFPANRLALHNTTLQIAIAIAFDHDSTRISGPDWLNDQCYTIDAKVDGDKQLSREEMEPLVQNLLQERFHLVVHHETKSLSGYALIVAKDSPKLRPSKEGSESHFYILPNGIDMRDAGIATLAHALSSQGAAGGPVIDKTGIQGEYDITLHYATVRSPNSNLPDIFTALQEQLGLKLVAQKVPVDTLVIDHVDKVPTEN
jgi:uncharacterized protein (TIGR03435 family)